VAVTVTVCGSGGQAVPVVSSQPPPDARSLQVGVTNTAGDWMVAIVTWRQPETSTSVTCMVGDDALNEWEPLGSPSANSSAAGETVCSIWYSPAAMAASHLLVAPSAPVVSMCVTVLDISGMTPWAALTGLSTAQAAGTALTALTLGAPASQAIVFTACGSDLNTDTITRTGTGWTTITPVTASNGTNHTGDLTLTAAYQVTTGSASVTWSSSGSQDLCGIIAGLLVTVTAPAQPNPMWPAVTAELALNAGPASHPDQLTWTPVTARQMHLDVMQGRQYQLASLQTGSGSVTLDNPDGQLIPPGSGTYAGIDSGTPFRVRTTWQGGTWQMTFRGDGSTAAPQATTGTLAAGWNTVTPGQPYSSTMWLACTPAYSSGMQLILNWRTAGGSLVSSVTSATVTSQTAVLVTAAGTAPGTAAVAEFAVHATGTPAATVTFQAAAAIPGSAAAGYLTIPPAVTWTGQDAATVTTAAPWAPDVRGAPQASPSSVFFSGFIQKWPQQWDAETQRGIVAASLVDAWNYVNGNLQPILFEQILALQPYAYWPCTEGTGAGQASNHAPMNPNPLVVVRSKYGAGTATEGFGQNASAIPGAQGTVRLTASVRQSAQGGMWGQALGSSSNLTQGYSLTCTDPGYPPVSSGVTIEFWFQVVAPFNLLQLPRLVTVCTPPGIEFDMFLDVTGSGHLILDAGGPRTTSTVTISSVNYLTAGSPLTHVALSFNRTTWTSYINGTGITTGSWATSLSPEFTCVSFNGLAGSPAEATATGAISENQYAGYTGQAAAFPAILTQEQVNTIHLAGSTGMTGDTAQYRIERLLQHGGYLGRRIILQETGSYVTPVVSCQDISGQPASTSISNIAANTVPGTLTVTPAGELFYLARQYAYNQPVQWVLGDRPDLGEIPVDPTGFLVDYDPARVLNDVQLTQLDNQDIVLPSVSEAASQAQYGDVTYWQTGYLANDLTSGLTAGPGLTDLANWIATASSKPALRPAAVTVNAAANPAAWPFVLQATAGDMVTVNRRPPTSGVTYSFTGRISQTTRTLTAGLGGTTGQIVVTIDAAPEASVLTADDPARGQLTGSNVLAW
jgi:hypothetical protein